MCSRPVHHWGYFLFDSLGTDEAEKVRRSHVADNVADYLLFKQGIETLFKKFEFEGSYRAMLKSHMQSGSESIATYASRTTDVCSKAYPNFCTETQLSLVVHHFVSNLVDSTTRDYLLHDRACRLLIWQETVQLAQACEASSHSLPPLSSTAACTKSIIYSNKCTCAGTESAHSEGYRRPHSRTLRAKNL